MKELVLATGNPGKVRELQALLHTHAGALPGGEWRVRPQSDFGIESAEETGLSFVENALIKARHASRASGLPAIADDSGLVCDALGGAPGIHSARYAGPQATDAANVEKLLQALRSVAMPRRTAHFVCVVAWVVAADDPRPLIAEAAWAGRITLAPRGTGGFGYDPVFEIPDMACTAAELEPARKQALSHRGRAFVALLGLLATRAPAV